MRITWITNIPTPYRVALWHALVRRCKLDVITMSTTLPNRQWDGASLLTQVNGLTVNAPMLHLADDLTMFWPNRALRNALQSCGDVVLIDGWESPSYQYAGWKARRCGAAVMVFYQSTTSSHRFSRGLIARFRSLLLRSADAVITAGPASREAVIRMGVANDRVFDGSNPIQVQEFVRPALPQMHAITSRHVFIYVGQLVERKNVRSVLIALKACPSDTNLIVVGDGPLRTSLHNLTKELGIAERVRFVGSATQDEIIYLLHGQAQTLILPSTREVYGLVVPEALAAGLHCIVSEACGVALSVKSMDGVFICAPTADDIGAAMLKSRDAWRGPIESPEILKHTPEALAAVVVTAAHFASRTRH